MKDFVTNNKFVEINKVIATNVNNYPFITFIDGDNKAENVYFSIEAAKEVDAGQVVDSALLNSYNVVEYTTEAGEFRRKISRKGEGKRLRLADLL